MFTRKRVLLFSITLVFSIITIGWVVSGQGGDQAQRVPLIIDRPPVGVIQDPYPAFHGIDMDVERGELFVADDNRSSVSVYRTDFSPHDGIHEPARRIMGQQVDLGYACGVAVSPEHKEIYAVGGEGHSVKVFSTNATGDVAPSRIVGLQDRATVDVFFDRKHDELFVSIQHTNKVAVQSRTAAEDDEPVRFIQGPKTGLSDPHGIFVDADHDEVYVANQGHWQRFESGEKHRNFMETDRTATLTPSTGKFLPPSITVYSRTAQGDAAPLRIIQGPRTGLNRPERVYLDPVSDQIAVTNSGDASVLFFEREAHGNVAPVRILQGPATGLAIPAAVFVDTIGDELWVSNWGNHTATVYPRTAQGDVPPLRTIRSAPKGTLSLGLGNIGDVAYDPKRKEILVPN